MKRILQFIYMLYAALWFVILILLAFPFALMLMLLPKRQTDNGMFLILKIIANIWFLVIGMITVNYHRRKIAWDRSYIIMANHQSFLDAAIIYTAFIKPFKTLGKIELEKTPIYGIIYKLVVITVDRSSVTAKANSFRRMKQELDSGISVGIFPEGTFSDILQQDLLPFQNGGFALALLQQVNILPVLFLDSGKRFYPAVFSGMTPGWNRTVFLPPIAIEGWDKRAGEALKSYTQDYMQTCLTFCREQDPKGVWDFAQQWLSSNPIIP